MSNEDALSNASISIRIVHVDHYQQPLHNYSTSVSFQAARMTSITSQQTQTLPVIRIFGSTPTGQSCCLHIHGLRPYMYLPLPSQLSPQQTYQYSIDLKSALEDCLKNTYLTNNSNTLQPSSDTPSNFISDIEPVLKYDVYGYHPTQTPFLKIYTYAPQTISRIANIVSQKGLPANLAMHAPLPYTSHIPFVMQFLVDYSLSGMDYIHLSQYKFRTPLPPIHTQTNEINTNPQSLFNRRNIDRIFVDGLQTSHPHLFWPFHVSRRSACPVELDTFPEHIINAKHVNVKDTKYVFTSKTLAVLWEEERLRTGAYPPRSKSANRLIKAGAGLTNEFMLERLQEICQAKDESNKASPKNGEQHVESSDQFGTDDILKDQCNTNAGNPALNSQLSSYDDVLQALDASNPLPTLEILEEEHIHQAQGFEGIEEIEEDDEEPYGESDNDEENILNTWKDIAACTQSNPEEVTSPKQQPLLQKKDSLEKVPRTDDELSSDATLTLPVCSDAEFIVAPESPRQPKKRSRSGSEIQKTQSHTQKTSELFEPHQLSQDINPKLSSGNIDRNTVSEVHSLKNFDDTTEERHLSICPRLKPPSLNAVQISLTDEAFKIAYVTPFYGQKKDEVPFREAFGGKYIPVRQSGVEGIAEFPISFETNETKVEIIPRIICPVQKPPLTTDLYREIKLREGTNSVIKNGTTNMAIDSAGRQIHQKVMDSDFWYKGSSSIHSEDEVTFSAVGRMLGNKSNPIGSLDSSVKRDPDLVAESSPSRQDTLEYNRPLSPKYDEAYQMPVNAVHNSGTRSRVPPLDLRRSASKSNSDRLRVNSTISPSQSIHRFQNVSLMSLEILASSYSNKTPDPIKNEVIAVCVATTRDDPRRANEESPCVILAVDQSYSIGDIGYAVLLFDSETALLDGLAHHIRTVNPDIIVGFETQNSSIGYLLERSHALGHPFPQNASRWLKGGHFVNPQPEGVPNNPAAAYYKRKGADIKLIGRHIVSLWRIVRKEVKLSAYSREAVASELFGTTFPKHKNNHLEQWLSTQKSHVRALRYLSRLTFLNIAIVRKLDVVGRTGELARVFGIDFMSVLTRGSQYRVESMMRRVAVVRDFVLLAATRDEVFRQPAVEALPLVMEPESALYVDPVIVLDFQSLYPSVVIAHNLCFTTMLGNLNRISSWAERRRIGVRPHYDPPSYDEEALDPIKNVFVASNGEMFVDASIRRGILPQLLEEILETRVMVKKAMKSIVDDDATSNMLNARQFGLKMIANVTYGYTSASFSGRMPCSGLADAIVQCGRDSLEEIIRFVDGELNATTGATVVYGDTDSLFVKVAGATREEAFKVGEMIVEHAAKIFPDPITLKLEKVYQPCVLQTKKRYVGYCYESPTQAVPTFDAKGIETIRRDSCPLVQKALEKSIRILFETKDISLVKRYTQDLCTKLHQGRVPFADYIFRKEVRLGSYKEGHLPPAAIVATKTAETDPRSVPRHGERVAFVVVYERPGAPLKDCVVSPDSYLESMRQGSARLNTTYYITKQILPALARIFSLVGVRVSVWYADLPRPVFDAPIQTRKSHGKFFYSSEKCAICHGKGRRRPVCDKCVKDETSRQASRYVLVGRALASEQLLHKLVQTCKRCIGDEPLLKDEICCTNYLCNVYEELETSQKVAEHVQEILDIEDIWANKSGQNNARRF